MRAFVQKQNQPQQRASSTTTRSGAVASALNPQAHPFLNLGRTIGNQALQRLLRQAPGSLEARPRTTEAAPFGHGFTPVLPQPSVSVQTKSTASTPGDVYEQEADRVADDILSMPDHLAPVQRMCSDCREEREQEVQRKLGEGGMPAIAGPRSSAAGLVPGEGHRLPASVLNFFEPRFGLDFGRVRVHTDAAAGEAARHQGALAYTTGRDIVFGRGEYSPGTADGRRLLAHELAHVVQQNGQGSAVPAMQRQRRPDVSVSVEGNCDEPEARIIAIAILRCQGMLRTALDWFVSPSADDQRRVSYLLRSHFGNDSDNTHRAVHSRLLKVSTLLEWAGRARLTFVCVEASDPHCADDKFYAYVKGGDTNRIHICPYFLKSMTPEARLWGLIHECSHLAGARADRYIFNFGEIDDVTCLGTGVLVSDPLENADSYTSFVWCLVMPAGTVAHPVAPIVP